MRNRPVIAMTQQVQVVPARNEVRDCLDAAWTEFLDACGFDLIPVPTRVANCEAFLERVGADGIVLSGGGGFFSLEPENASPEREALEARMIAFALRKNIPLLGVCRGMQALVLHFGGELARVPGHVGVMHSVSVLSGLPGHERVNSFHDFGIPVRMLPDSLTPLALADDGTVEAVASRQGRCLGIMWHPERCAPFAARDIELFENFFCRG
ncbi:gamma-glutamyl-gamma-aminobutyrate hydrolase family protein [Pseudodesulfovibrio tunisiensis]|uniref:gamma-glutamyl-gamma-aminobutyrate hydrolase family protein n=1 Tax=Pseudodesulfovibrio tunisiensis TaxID=463192 RepID=UPI001FB4784C|nr:gamma-glutamyl-gamma-aminobutyrate hydrolase family protein [Pseudodesulfovibrio tunisiensis]